MSFESIDALQRTLADTVFQYAADRKKAAGRALGTLVEMVTYFTLRAWGLSDHIIIERRVPEFANPDILHNVEFSLHHVNSKHKVQIRPLSLPLTPAKLKRQLEFLAETNVKSTQVLTTDSLKRNATLLAELDSGPVVANISALKKSRCTLTVCELSTDPFAILECKRVGVEEGMKKGPQTIEKAKQGAYVARSVSSLQKVRLRNGQVHGLIEQADGTFIRGPYLDLLSDIIEAPPSVHFPLGFILTVGVVSNHGNWFTSGDHNKELRILAQSYDWLLFLTDRGLAKFIDNVLLNPEPALRAASEAFLTSYSGKRGMKRGTNRFTKVRIDVDADAALQRYFASNKAEVESWFNVISPRKGTLPTLRSSLRKLAEKTRPGTT